MSKNPGSRTERAGWISSLSTNYYNNLDPAKPVNGCPAFYTRDSSAENTQPAFSPDGQSIAFRSERDGGIFLMGATGESVKRLTDFGFNPAWSPDGKEIVIAAARFVGPEGAVSGGPLWIVNVASGDKRQLGKGNAVQPAWSPHNRRIAFWTLFGPGHRTGYRDIWTMRTDGTDWVSVTNDLAIDWNPVWSPDGKFLYFVSDRSGSMNIWRVPIDEESGRTLGALEAVTTGGSGYRGFLTLSGDGKRIVYADVLNSSCIYKVPFDPIAEKVTGPPVAITQGSRFDVDLALSPDGLALVFVSAKPNFDLWVMQTDGSALRQLTNGPARDTWPAWSHHGNQIAFYSNRSEKYQIWTIRADGSDLRQITESKSKTGAQLPFWSPDDSQIIYRDCGDDCANGGDLWAVDPKKAPKDQVPVRLTDALAVTSWSSDGRDLLAATIASKPGIFVYSIPDRKLQQFSEFGKFPVWLNDNRRLLFKGSSAKMPDTKLYILDTQSRKIHEIFPAPQGSFFDGIPISPDNRTIYYPLYIQEADLWLISRR